MVAEFTNHLALNHLWQSTLYAVAAGVLAFVLRNNRAQVRYWLWYSASVKFVVPFALLMSAGSYWQRAPAAKQIAAAPAAIAMVEIAQPFSEAVLPKPLTQSSQDWILVAIFAVWGSGFAVIALMRLLDWRRIHAMVRASSPLAIRAPVEVRSSGGLLEPGVVGVLRPILLLPAGIQDRLTQAQLEAVLAHELCHVRRRDNLFAAVHMVVEAALWFHPLVWWIGARLVEERERACDEEVLRLGNAPDVYAEGILNVCKLYVESPLACVSGVTGSDLKKRIEAIMSHRSALQMNLAKKIIMAVAGIAALAAPVAIGVLRAQPKASAIPKWEAVSIRPTKDCSFPGDAAQKDGKKSGDATTVQSPSPDRLNICVTVAGIIPQAYVYNASGQHSATLKIVSPVPIEGAPGWMNTDLFQINAKAEGTPAREMMIGPMLQALLEDRFKLKIRRESRDVPAYALTVAKGGLKVKPVKGTCAAQTMPPAPVAPGQLDCGPQGAQRKGTIMAWGYLGELGDFSKILNSTLDRPVIDKTGVAGVFNFHLEFTPDDNSPGLRQRYQMLTDDASPAVPADPTGGVSIFIAMQEQLGLKLAPTKGPREFLVIEHVEKPSPN